MNTNRLLENSIANGVTASATRFDGREACAIRLDDKRRAGTRGVDFVDQPTFLLLPEQFKNGVIAVDLCGTLLPDAPDQARGFIGIAYRISSDRDAFEAIYIRPANGFSHEPGKPREDRAIQYFAYPDWPFDRLRDEHPDRFEAGADIALRHWHRLSIELDGRHFRASVDGVEILTGEGLIEPVAGQVGLWVDIGTQGYFANVSVTGA